MDDELQTSKGEPEETGADDLPEGDLSGDEDNVPSETPEEEEDY